MLVEADTIHSSAKGARLTSSKNLNAATRHGRPGRRSCHSSVANVAAQAQPNMIGCNLRLMGQVMRRREFIASIAVLAADWPMLARRAVAVLAGSFLVLGSAHAAQVRLLCPGSLKGSIETLAAKFEGDTGHEVEVVFDIIKSIADRVRAGQPFDLAIETPTQWERLASEGKIDPAVRANIASVKWALYTKKGASKPNIGTVDGLKQALLNAKSIAY